MKTSPLGLQIGDRLVEVLELHCADLPTAEHVRFSHTFYRELMAGSCVCLRITGRQTVAECGLEVATVVMERIRPRKVAQ